MNLCIPTVENKQLESKLSGHFGSAPYFMIVDTDTGTIISTINRQKTGQHSSCQPLLDLINQPIDAIAATGIGNGALRNLLRNGIAIYRAEGETIAETLAALENGSLQELSETGTCHSHGHGQEHGHGHRHGSHRECNCGC